MTAAQGAPDIPEAASMFSLTAEPPLMEHGDIIEHA